MQYKLNKKYLLDILRSWNGFLKKKVNLIACGGTAMTLLDIKESTIDIDLLVPKESEHVYLTRILEDIGYKNEQETRWVGKDGFKFDLFIGKTIFQTELLESPLKEDNNILLKDFGNIYLGILNYYDLIISKLFRYTSTDRGDCLELIKSKRDEINLKKLKSRFYETSSYDVFDKKNKRNFELFSKFLKKEGISI